MSLVHYLGATRLLCNKNNTVSAQRYVRYKTIAIEPDHHKGQCYRVVTCIRDGYAQDTVGYAHGYADTRTDTRTDTRGYAHGYADTHTDTRIRTDTRTDTRIHGYAHGYADTRMDTHGYADGYADTQTDTQTDTVGYARIRARIREYGKWLRTDIHMNTPHSHSNSQGFAA